MATAKEIKNRIRGVSDTRKITNAMYLISSTKIRKARKKLEDTRPFFNEVSKEIKRIFRINSHIDNRYFYPESGEFPEDGAYAYLIITSDKGLAGSYNINVIKESLELLSKHHTNKLYVMGEYGRHFFPSRNIPIEENFFIPLQSPSIHMARKISEFLLDKYNNKEIDKIFLVYTHMENGMNITTRSTRLLPFHRTYFNTDKVEKQVQTPFEFVPSMEKVLDSIIPSYVTGFIYSALVDSFCSEQESRLTAMKNANDNAQELIDELTLEYNHLRQGSITQEIIEISSGAGLG